MYVWLVDSLHRVFPQSAPEERRNIRLDLLRGERGSAQVACRTGEQAATISVSVDGPEGIDLRVRRVGYVPMAHFTTEVPEAEIDGIGHLPGLVPDPLFEESSVESGLFETNSFWITIAADRDAGPGDHDLTVTVSDANGGSEQLTIALTIHAAKLPERRDFPVTNWFYANALVDWYGVDFLSEPFWTILEPYLRNLAGHGQDTIYVPLFTPPLDDGG